MSYLGDIRSPHGHALLVLAKEVKSKIQVVQEQKQFKDMPSSTYLTSSESRTLHLSG